MCTELHCLPDDGGLFDQNPSNVNKLDKTLQARNQWFQDDSNKKQATATAQERLKDRYN